MENEHLKTTGFFEAVESQHGPVKCPGVPTCFSQTPGRVAGPAPELGGHPAEVIREYGLLAPAVKAATEPG